MLRLTWSGSLLRRSALRGAGATVWEGSGGVRVMVPLLMCQYATPLYPTGGTGTGTGTTTTTLLCHCPHHTSPSAAVFTPPPPSAAVLTTLPLPLSSPHSSLSHIPSMINLEVQVRVRAEDSGDNACPLFLPFYLDTHTPERINCRHLVKGANTYVPPQA
ncbi:hypothetical protein E2C01_077767 [Portunus trituberculatus]|uniref:Uncharacterized protein n=1 Tax=Portunus trituberculatus TaxID=210409 RepID=A0A5B7IN68_PORTR|nr:hypothetical protein [Portunus trituberculatus]